jgi:hypothetical protein
MSKPWYSRKISMTNAAEQIENSRGRKVTNYVKTTDGKFDPQQNVTVPRAPQNKKGR